MDWPEHERLERILIQKRAATGKAAIDTEEFKRLDFAELQAIHNLKDHDADHGCQRAG
jgi:hypothetical protein